MQNRPELEAALGTILETLGAYVEDLVLVGGWVPYLHLAYGRAAVDGARTSLTGEADLVFPAAMARRGRRPIAEVLEAAGFRPIGDSGVVWGRDIERGEKIEFLRTHHGPVMRSGSPIEVEDQPRVRALTLERLWIQEAFTEEILIPAPGDGGRQLAVRVPLLAAFALNKANTFDLRGGTDREVKGGKDLLYLRDIMAAGENAHAVLEGDLERMAGSEERGRVLEAWRRAARQLRMVAPGYHTAAGAILAEREGMAPPVAQADVEGHLTDLTEILLDRFPDDEALR